jgi:hypothetical protein
MYLPINKQYQNKATMDNPAYSVVQLQKKVDQYHPPSIFSKEVLQLAQKAMFANRRNLHDCILQNLCKLEKAETIVSVLTKTKVSVGTWGLTRSILMCDLAMVGIDCDEKALEYINKLAPQLDFFAQTD